MLHLFSKFIANISNNHVVFFLVLITAGSGSSFTRRVNKSSANTVCVLVRVTAKTDSANINSIEKNSQTDDFYIVPVARSYNNRKWERVAGPYAQDLTVSTCCDLDIPNLPDLDDGRFVLISFSNTATDKEEVSRFFQQTTFGPDLDMINEWDYSNDMTQEMSKWLKSQMDESETPMTSHRAFFRERVDFHLYDAEAIQYLRPAHPCAKYARWREYSFIQNDYYSTLVVSRWSGKYLLTVDGVPRTVMDTWRDEDSGNNLRLGTWGFCKLSP